MVITSKNAKNTSLETIISNASQISLLPTVLILDSGVGGLSVYKHIQRLLPNLHYIYTFDNFAFPYGEKSEEFIITRVLKIIAVIHQYHTLTLVVIACNTASIISLPTLRTCFSFPIIGVVPAIKPAVLLTRNKIIGLLATKVTIACSYTQDLIKRFASGCKVRQLWSSELVKLAEAKLHGTMVSIDMLKDILIPWINKKKLPDTIVLGCTHFPLLIEELIQILPQGIQIIDSGAAIARRTFLLLSSFNKKISTKENIAYCLVKNTNTDLLLPILQQYGFTKIKILSI
ncbi:glutamate racemase [Candidatus Fukatsuia anoeciicola]|uniref:glutamate racemase n=1 Tax=Candidatus Fukatsuia anoeciicola TaxID=2994492 RepID=UPI0034640DB5